MLKSSALAAILLTVCCLITRGDDAPAGDAPSGKGRWVQISNELIARLENSSQKPAWPGKTAGITVDPATGDVYMVVAGQGIWKSIDHGATFTRSDFNRIGGRCETGSALQFDPNGKRLACFMLDGTGGMTVDSGENWSSFASVGRNWDYAAVDWSGDQPVNIFAMRHESGGELYLSTDAGQHWIKVAKDLKYSSVGIVDATTVLTSKIDGGIFRSADAGMNWTRVADFTVTSHVAANYKGTLYLIAKEGLIASADHGVTWTARGAAVEANHGPIFKDEQHLIVWGKKGIEESTDAGKTWKLAAPLPEGYQKWKPEWMTNVGWDTRADIFYASHMSMPAYRWER